MSPRTGRTPNQAATAGAAPKANATVHTLVVGGTGGIGRVLVDLLVSDGHRVSVIARRASGARSSGMVGYTQADLTSPASLAAAGEAVRQTGGPLNNLVFLQRFRGGEPTWHDEMDNSLSATHAAIDRFAAHFPPEGGAIVVVSSVNARLVAADLPVGYHVVKAGLNQLVRYYAVTLGPRGIRVNSVSPGTVVKPETASVFEGHRKLQHLYGAIVPLRRLGTARDVADVIAFLCSPRAAYLTGQDIVIDGGLSLVWQESLAMALRSIERPTRKPTDRGDPVP